MEWSKYKNSKEIEDLIFKQIPLSRNMGLRVVQLSIDQGVRFELPLEPNKNHKETAFGGSLVAAQAVACWSWVMILLCEANLSAEVVLQRQSAEFLLPTSKDFEVEAFPLSLEERYSFIKTLNHKGKARLSMKARVRCQGQTTTEFSGDYVAILVSANKKIV